MTSSRPGARLTRIWRRAPKANCWASSAAMRDRNAGTGSRLSRRSRGGGGGGGGVGERGRLLATDRLLSVRRRFEDDSVEQAPGSAGRFERRRQYVRPRNRDAIERQLKRVRAAGAV